VYRGRTIVRPAVSAAAARLRPVHRVTPKDRSTLDRYKTRNIFAAIGLIYAEAAADDGRKAVSDGLRWRKYEAHSIIERAMPAIEAWPRRA
jgi:hypothetical protein